MSVEESSVSELSTTQRHVVRRAAALFRRRGVTTTTMREVADAVGLSKAGLYHHYRSKDELLRDIVGTGADALEVQLRAIQQMDAAPQHKLQAFIRTRMETIAEHQDVLTVIWQERPLIGEAAFASVARRLDDYRGGLTELITSAQHDGVVRADVDAHLLTLAIDGMTGWAYLWFREDGPRTPSEIGEAFWSYLFDSVAV